MDPLEKRVTDLEIKITYQDDLIQTLNDVIVELRTELGMMHKRIGKLEEHARSDGEDDRPANEPPPHY